MSDTKDENLLFSEVAHALRAVPDDFALTGRGTALPDRREVIAVLKTLQGLMFPAYFSFAPTAGLTQEETLARLLPALTRQIAAAYGFRAVGDCSSCVCSCAHRDTSAACAETPDAREVALALFSRLPAIRDALLLDAVAIYEGDPAARSPEEVILCYPGFYAISIYRIAHAIYRLGVPFLPRMMTEYAHEKTGIDIHAGAEIGDSFFIDHGTGIVIGETTVIGHHVKIYQGVTLGAKSFEVDADGNPVKGIKRHPDIGNHVIIYANATILGGNTSVGDGCVIGANVWLTHSVPPGQVVYYTER